MRRAHLVRVVLSQHLRKLHVKRFECPRLRAALELRDMVVADRDGHGTVEARRHADVTGPHRKHAIEHELSLHADRVDGGINSLGEGTPAAARRRIAPPIRRCRPHRTFEVRAVGIRELPAGAGMDELRGAQTKLGDVLVRRPRPGRRQKAGRRRHVAHEVNLGLREEIRPFLQFFLGGEIQHVADEEVRAAHHRSYRRRDAPHGFARRDVRPDDGAADRQVDPHHRGVGAAGLDALLDPGNGGLVHHVDAAVEPVHGRQDDHVLVTLDGRATVEKVVHGLGCRARNGPEVSHDALPSYALARTIHQPPGAVQARFTG